MTEVISPAMQSRTGASKWLPAYVRGLLFKEWLAHRNTVVGFWAAWLLLQMAMLIFNHPGWLLALGLLYAIMAAASMGGIDAAEGSEEFAFSLPPTRGDILLVRLALGGGNLVLLLLAGIIALAAGVPQALWGLAVESGLTEPFPPASGLWYAVAFCTPPAVFATSFMTAALAQSRASVNWSWLLGLLAAGVVTAAGVILERLVWHRVTGFFFCPALLLMAAGAAFSGYYLFIRKEGLSRPTPLRRASYWWVWVLVVVVLFLSYSHLFYGYRSSLAPEGGN